MTDEIALPVREPLSRGDLLAHVDLVAEEERYGPEHRVPVRESGVRCGRPLIYPLTAEELPAPLRSRLNRGTAAYVGVLFAFDLDELPAGRRYSLVRFRVALADDKAMAVIIEPDPAPLPGGPGWAGGLRSGTERATVSVMGVLSARFGGTYRALRNGSLSARSYTLQAVIEVPPGTNRLTGVLSVAVEISRTVFDFTSLRSAASDSEVPFVLELASGYERPAVRLCMSVDVEKYSRHSTPATKRTQTRLLEVLTGALRNIGFDDGQVAVQASGDGRFLVFPPGIDETVAIPGLVEGLQTSLRHVNQDLGPQARVRLRVAFHRGVVEAAPNGFVGDASIAVHRILDCRPLREALTEAATADFALIVPEFLYRDVIAQNYGKLLADRFRPVNVEILSKSFTEQCRIYLPPADQ
jgi:hypothetical protein